MPTPLISASDIPAGEFPAFAALSSPDQALVIAAGSQAVERACDRILGQSTQVEIYYPEHTQLFRLRQWPVQSVKRISAGLNPVLILANIAPAVQEATVSFTTAAADPLNQVVTGIQLDAVASGVDTTTPLLFSTYTTLNSLAAAINGLSGWTAAVQTGGDATTGGWGLFGTSRLLFDLGAQGCKGISGGSAPTNCGAALKMFTCNLGFGIDANNDSRIGKITLRRPLPQGFRFPDRMYSGGGYGGYGSGFGGGSGYGGSADSWASDPRVGGVQVVYTAGWATPDVPADLKQATVMAAKWLYEATASNWRVQSQTVQGRSVTFAQMLNKSLPDFILGMLDYYMRKELI